MQWNSKTPAFITNSKHRRSSSQAKAAEKEREEAPIKILTKSFYEVLDQTAI